MPKETLKNRNNYSYPTVALQGSYTNPSVITFQTTTELDKYIQGLLLSKDKEEKILGYLSVIFWGFYSGKDGIIRENRALGKVRIAREGRERVVKGVTQRIRGIVDLGEDFIENTILTATNMINEDNYSQALKELNKLPQLQIAFSSKVCAFINPTKCGVIDSVISKNHPQLGFKTSNTGMIKNTTTNRDLYRNYCIKLQEKARSMNKNTDLMWTDRDKKTYKWRALDIERSMY